MKRSLLFLLIVILGLVACGGQATSVPLSSATPGPTSATTATSGGATSAATTTTALPVPTTAAALGPPAPTVAPTVNPGIVPILSAQQAGATPLKELWKANLNETSPAELIGEADDLLFVKTLSGGLYAFNLKDGSPAWKQSGPPPVPTPTALPSPTPAPSATPLPPDPIPVPRAPFAAVVTSTVMIGDSAAQTIFAYDTKTGQKKWEASVRFEAPNRDPGTRFLPGAVYEDTLVVVVSSKVNPFAIRPTPNPEYLRLVGLDIATGKQKWAFIPDPARSDADFRQGGITYGTKTIVVEGPDLSTFALEPKSGASLWRAFGLFLIPSPISDNLYALAAQPSGKPHNPILRRVDITNGKLIWQKELPIQLNSDPPVTISPDEKTIYAAVFTAPQKSFLWAFDTTSGDARQTDTAAYGIYDMLATNEGIMLIQATPSASGVVYFTLSSDRPRWAMGGVIELLFGPQLSPEKTGLYFTFRDEFGNGFIYIVNNQTGQVTSATRTDLPTSPPVFGLSQKTLYLIGNETKPQIHAYARP